jgi:hypothetical protein
MQLKEAIEILMMYCGRYSRDGDLNPVRHYDRLQMGLAAERLFEYTYQRKPHSQELYNLGFMPREDLD